MGILPGARLGKATMETIPSLPDKSIFSCERYQFFLDAPFEIGQQCCRVMKKNPSHEYQRRTGLNPIIATMASESRLRTQQWLKNGCNAFNTKIPTSTPMSFWFEDDVLTYMKVNNIKPCSIYGDIVSDDEETGQLNLNDIMGMEVFDLGRPTYHTTGCSRSGCITCLFGYHHENTPETSRIQNIIDLSNPKIADWMLRGGHFRESDGMWEPYQGLGYAFIMEWCNLWGDMKYWYPNREHYLKQLPEECWRYLQK